MYVAYLHIASKTHLGKASTAVHHDRWSLAGLQSSEHARPFSPNLSDEELRQQDAGPHVLLYSQAIYLAVSAMLHASLGCTISQYQDPTDLYTCLLDQ